MVKHYSNNIQNVIQRELFTANSSIKIAVAWFTNDLLFQPLLLKLATGVKVDLILNKDEINLSSSIDFNLFALQGGNLYWNESNRLMHEKFCIIDDRVVITGSYNWTNKAEVNYESISIFIDEQDTITDYKARFQAFSRNFVRQTPQVKPQPIVNSGKCPASLQPYTKLKFYHSIKLFESSNTPILANQYEEGPYALLDSKTFLPRTQFMFSDYSSFIPGRNYLWLKGETKWGLFDCEKLEFVVKPQFEEVDKSYSGGFFVKNNGELGAVSLSGNVLLSCNYEEITDYRRCLIFRKANEYGILRSHDGFIVNKRFDGIEKITDNGIIVKKEGKYGVINIEEELLPCIYDEILEFKYVYVFRRGDKYGVFIRFRICTKCEYDSIDRLDANGDLYVMVKQSKKKLLFGSTILEQEYDDIQYQPQCKGYVAIVWINGKCGLWKDGKILLPCEYDRIELGNKPSIKDGKYGFINEQGDIISTFSYDKITCFGEKEEKVFLAEKSSVNGALYDVFLLNTKTITIFEHSMLSRKHITKTIAVSCKHVECCNIFGDQALIMRYYRYYSENTPTPIYSIYFLKTGILLRLFSKIRYASKFNRNIMLLHPSIKDCNKYYIYLYDENRALKGLYENATFYEGGICLQKNGKYGAYVLDSNKYIECVYDTVSYYKPTNSLIFKTHDNLQESFVCILK